MYIYMIIMSLLYFNFILICDSMFVDDIIFYLVIFYDDNSCYNMTFILFLIKIQNKLISMNKYIVYIVCECST